MTETTDDELQDVGLGPAVDPVLQAFCNVARRNDDFDLQITLWVAGGVLTGTMVNFKRWMTEVGEVPTVGGDPGFFKQMADIILDGLDDEADEKSRPPARFINLVDARGVQASGLFPTNNGMLWRGRLSEVSGWSLGGMS